MNITVTIRTLKVIHEKIKKMALSEDRKIGAIYTRLLKKGMKQEGLDIN